MLPLVAIHSEAIRRGKKLLQERDPKAEHGCLHDFSVDRALFTEKLRRGPVMCGEEYVAIASVFDSIVAGEYKAILQRVANGAP
jgi:hypothetical protein